MRYLKALGLAAVAAMAMLAFSSAVAAMQIIPTTDSIDGAELATVAAAACLFAAACTRAPRRASNQREKAMTRLLRLDSQITVTTETEFTSSPGCETGHTTTTQRHHNEQINHNEEADEKRHLNLRLAEACI